jgi:hypothetical protein
VSELEKRKKMLVAECEVYRQTLKLELHNLKISALRNKRRITSFRPSNALLTMLPMISVFFTARRRRFSWKQLTAAAFVGLQLYNRFAPLCRGLFVRETRESESMAPARATMEF